MQQHLLDWVASNGAEVVSAENLVDFIAQLESLPWAGMHLDWTQLDGIEVDLRRPDLSLERARIGRCDLALAFIDSASGGIVAPIRSIIESLDELYWTSPGYRYICGASGNLQGKFTLEFNSIGEYDGGHVLRLRA
ncbi:hypothetical protein GCM10009788_13950 [Nocardioides humi]|uniref:Uncharacterized protein n=1 Tax=Nocardioides humi TaxID=449461 RepID=A0ABN2A4W7_9ACTN